MIVCNMNTITFKAKFIEWCNRCIFDGLNEEKKVSAFIEDNNLSRKDFVNEICKVLKEKDAVVNFTIGAADGKFEIVEAKVDNGK